MASYLSMIGGMTSKKLSISVPSDLLERADQVLAQPGEGHSALFTRVLTDALRAAEDAEIDAIYDRALREHPVRQEQLDRTNALARAAFLSARDADRARTQERSRGASV